MKKKYLLLILLSFVLAMFDVSFFSFLDLYGGTIFLSIVATIMVGLFFEYDLTLTYGISAILFLTVFSSLPVLVMLVGFLAVPMIIAYLRKNYIPELPIIGAVPIIVGSLLLFEISFMIAVGAVSVDIITTALFFIVLNSTVGVFVYGLILKQTKKHKIGMTK